MVEVKNYYFIEGTLTFIFIIMTFVSTDFIMFRPCNQLNELIDSTTLHYKDPYKRKKYHKKHDCRSYCLSTKKIRCLKMITQVITIIIVKITTNNNRMINKYLINTNYYFIIIIQDSSLCLLANNYYFILYILL